MKSVVYEIIMYLNIYVYNNIIGLPPKISVINGTDTVDITVESNASLYFEVFTYPPTTSEPQLTVNGSKLSAKWEVVYKSSDMKSEISFLNITSLSHFFVEIKTENFNQEDSGNYSITVSNICSLSVRTVTLKGK